MATEVPRDGALPERYRTLFEVAETIATHRNLGEVCCDLAQLLPKVVPVNFVALALYNPASHTMTLHSIQANIPIQSPDDVYELPVDETPAGYVWRTQEPLFIADIMAERRWPAIVAKMQKDGLQSVCGFPLTVAGRRLGTIGFCSVQQDAYHDGDVDFLCHVAKQVAVAVDNALAYEEIARLRDKVTKEKLYLEEEIKSEYDDIVGESRALKRVLKQVETVAGTDSTVLILGETGSGKELVARAVHHLSRRRERTFVKLNCAAIPTGLVESELFGHDKGAFTGAIATKIGRFELADHGTLFLDEVGEIPLELQVKLLRVLQEQEFERLGSTRTLRVNVRLIAATNRELERMVEEGRFRSDLYYRLKVFPIRVPALRERPEDIPMLVHHFVQKFAQRMKKQIETIPRESMTALQQYSWPGNIRELENFIERAVILSQTTDLEVPVSELKRPTTAADRAVVSLEDAERQHILKALHEARWVIGGQAGAAAKLGIKRTTLNSKMQKLGISRLQ